MTKQQSIAQFWQNFVTHQQLAPQTTYVEAFHFERSEVLANALLDLVRIGKKKATCSSLEAFALTNSKVPQVGEYSILTDWKGTAYCVIQTTAVTITPFNQIPFALCRLEGEDDTLESWQDGHRRFFQSEGAALGYVFREDLPVVFEEFSVVYQRSEHD